MRIFLKFRDGRTNPAIALSISLYMMMGKNRAKSILDSRITLLKSTKTVCTTRAVLLGFVIYLGVTSFSWSANLKIKCVRNYEIEDEKDQ